MAYLDLLSELIQDTSTRSDTQSKITVCEEPHPPILYTIQELEKKNSLRGMTHTTPHSHIEDPLPEESEINLTRMLRSQVHYIDYHL